VIAWDERSHGADWHLELDRALLLPERLRISEGLTNAEIGQELFISPKTASSHIEHIMAKLGVTRRAEIATWVATVSGASRRSAASDSRVASST